MNEPEPDNLTYEQKEARLDEILGRLDRSQTPMDQLAAEAKEAAQLIMSMQTTLRAAKQEVSQVFAEMDKQKDVLGLKSKSDDDLDDSNGPPPTLPGKAAVRRRESEDEIPF